MREIGLIIFVLCVQFAVGVLLYDLYLKLKGKPTISQKIWNKLDKWKRGEGPFPWESLLLPFVAIIAATGLLMHFFM